MSVLDLFRNIFGGSRQRKEEFFVLLGYYRQNSIEELENTIKEKIRIGCSYEDLLQQSSQRNKDSTRKLPSRRIYDIQRCIALDMQLQTLGYKYDGQEIRSLQQLYHVFSGSLEDKIKGSPQIPYRRERPTELVRHYVL